MKSVLVVDDNAAVRFAVRQWLLTQDWRVKEAVCGEVALPMILGGQADAVVCDLEMEPGDGFWLYAQVRRLAQDREIPFLFLAAPKTMARQEVLAVAKVPLFFKGVPGPGMPELVEYLRGHLQQ